MIEEEESGLHKITLLQNSLSDIIGGVGRGFALVAVGHPLDTIKVRLQTQSNCVNFLDVAGSIVRKEGLLSFYRGSGPPLYSSAVFSAYYLWFYGTAKRLILGDLPKTVSPTFIQMTCVGIMCGFGSSFINSPVELVKCKLQSTIGGKRYTNTFDCTAGIFKEYGFRGLGQGYISTLLRNTIGDIGYYGVYELSKYQLKRKIGDYWGILLAGGLGGMAFWTLIYPLDVIKSKLQTQPFEYSQRLYYGILDCGQKIFQREGWRGFWRGFSVCLFRSFPTNAAGFFTYEICKEKSLQWFL